MNKEDIEGFAKILEEADYNGALDLIQGALIPLAEEYHISLYDAAWKYADQDEEQDTSQSQLFYALQKVLNSSIVHLDIYKPL